MTALDRARAAYAEVLTERIRDSSHYAATRQDQLMDRLELFLDRWAADEPHSLHRVLASRRIYPALRTVSSPANRKDPT